MIKKITRVIPETNSSSTHSISINTLSNNYSDVDDLTPLIKDDILYIPNCFDFDSSFIRYNDTITKIQYIGSLSEVKTNPKIRKKIKGVIKNFIGVKDVIFQWEEDYLNDIQEYLSSKKINGNASTNIEDIDINTYGPYNSFDGGETIAEEILENPSTIKNFIFNKDSWLFIGNDESKVPDEYFYSPFKKEKEDFYAIATIEFGGDIGNFDIEIKDVLDSINLYTFYSKYIFGEIQDFTVNGKTKEVNISNFEDLMVESVNMDEPGYSVLRLIHPSLYGSFRDFSNSFINIDNNNYIMFANNYVSDLLIKNMKPKGNDKKKILDNIIKTNIKDNIALFKISVSVKGIGKIL